MVLTVRDGGVQVFLNIVLDDAVEEKDGGEKVRIGTVVIRGNSVVMLEVRLRGLFPFPDARFLMVLRAVGFGEDKLEGGDTRRDGFYILYIGCCKNKQTKKEKEILHGILSLVLCAVRFDPIRPWKWNG